MINKLLSLAFKELKKKRYDAYLISLSNENLYEFVSKYDNYIIDLTGFTGDTGKLLITNKKAYLIVDGRFRIQAKREVKDKRIKIINADRKNQTNDFYRSILKDNAVFALDFKKNSIFKIKELYDEFGDKIIIKNDSDFLSKHLKAVKKDCFHMTCAPLFMLPDKYVSDTPYKKIKNIDFSGNYITSSPEEIAYLTNLRYKLCDIDDHNVLFDAFMIVNKKKSILYIKDYIDEKTENILLKNHICVKKYTDFYIDLRKIKDTKNVFIDDKFNNYYIYKILKLNDSNIVDSPLKIKMSIKGDKEIKNLRIANLLDGIAITKAIYDATHNKYKNEYEIKKMVDNKRKLVGGKEYLCPSFQTIVAYGENSAICHYSPDKNNSKKISNNSLLLIDSGGNYLSGSTDITRTISLYKHKVPSDVKMNYSLVLNAMIRLSIQVFPYGLSGTELDIVARADLYNRYMDFNHGTGHGIGYISNIHEGPNRITPYIYSDYKYNVMEVGQLTSDEPGLYFEGKYGIRIENDLLTVDDKNNKYGEFLSFETMTLCPYDRDLIDKKYLDKDVINYINNYNKYIYKKISPYLNASEKKWLKYETKGL